MRTKLLVSTATSAILAGLVFATAQEMPQGGNSDRMRQEQSAPGDQRRSVPQQKRNNADGAPRAQRSEPRQGGAGQGPGRSAQSESDGAQRSGNQSDEESRNRGTAKKRAQPTKQRDGTSSRQSAGQEERDQNRDRAGAGRSEQQPKQNAKQKRQQNDTDRTAGSQRQKGEDRRDERAGRDGQTENDRTASTRGRLELNSEQRTRIRETVLSRSNAPRVDRVNFNISVGVNVPARVHVAAVPSVIVDIYPRFRGHRYFVVRDEIIIVDNRRRIVAVIPVETAGVARGEAVAFVDLSPEEIREVQVILVERGYDIEVDGVLGPRTHRALRLFQERQGIEVTGRIDRRTVTRLGISLRSNETPSTTGQGGRDRTDQGGQRDHQAAPNETTNQQSGRRDGEPRAQRGGASEQRQSGQEPTTTGQGGGNQETPANRNRDSGATRAQDAQPPSADPRKGAQGKQSPRSRGAGEPDGR